MSNGSNAAASAGQILPDENMLLIFSFLHANQDLLSSCNLVCKSWSKLIEHDALWKPYFGHLISNNNATVSWPKNYTNFLQIFKELCKVKQQHKKKQLEDSKVKQRFQRLSSCRTFI